MRTYCRLYSSIIHSSIWSEPHHIRIVWITLLALKDKDGQIHASIGGLAHESRVTVPECREALEKLLAPDPDSTSPEYEGRRIERIEGGWVVLNHFKYRDAKEDVREYNRRKKRESRQKQKQWLGSPKTMEEKVQEKQDIEQPIALFRPQI